MRLRLHVAYDGAEYHGWQTQPDAPTIEDELTEAAAQILDRPVESVKVQGASRTDSGAHAVGQVAHLDCDRDRTPWEMTCGLNGLTADAICVNRVDIAPDTFHARFSAAGKTYAYRLWNHPFDHPLKHRRTWRLSWDLDEERMRRAADHMLGTHDFSAFRAADCVSPTTERTIQRIDIDIDGPRMVFTVEGDSFLKYMVRVMVGTLVEIGAGAHSPELVSELFASGDRGDAGRTAPADGLVLLDVQYPDHPWNDSPPAIGGPCGPDSEFP